MTAGSEGISRALMDFIDASPSPHHVVENAAERLSASGFTEAKESESWNPAAAAARGFVRRGGSLVAWRIGVNASATAGFRILGAHSDSPNLRIKPRPDTGTAGWRQLGVEVYGGALLNSWLDRDLGLSGIVVVDGPNGPATHLLKVDRPILRIPQLAIHLDRDVNERGLTLNKQTHMAPIWGLGELAEGMFVEFLAAQLDVSPDAVVSWSVMAHDLTPSTYTGLTDEFIAAPRIDNQASCFASLQALLGAQPAEHHQVICLFDHEEVGSVTASGAAGALLPTLLGRVTRTLGGDFDEHAVSLARSACASADGAHATHPNYPERHEPEHSIALNAGPVIKANANERYATGAESAARFVGACEAAGVPFQWFVNRTDLACGSTIGPVTSSQLGIQTVDVGIPQLAMHSAREMCGADDPPYLVSALTAYLS